MLSFTQESWVWYGLAWMVVIARLLSRRILLGSLRKLQIDDYLMIFAMITDTVLIAGMNVIVRTNSNLIDPKNPIELTPDVIAEREYGSKMVLVVEQMQCVTIWTVKACLLIMYSRLTISLTQHLLVKIVAVYVAVGFVVMEILYLGVWCRPFHEYWAVPPNNVQCSAATNHLITNAVLNISSDFMIILLPMPVFIQSQLPKKKKIILCLVFALGTFTILSAILNKYYSFEKPFDVDWTFWYIRESSTAIMTANLPLTYTLVRLGFEYCGLGSHLLSGSRRNTYYGRQYHNSNSRSQRSGSRLRPASHGPRASKNNPMPPSNSYSHRLARADSFEPLGSQDYHCTATASAGSGSPPLTPTMPEAAANKEYGGGGGGGVPLRIYQKRELRFSTHTIEQPPDGAATVELELEQQKQRVVPDALRDDGGGGRHNANTTTTTTRGGPPPPTHHARSASVRSSEESISNRSAVGIVTVCR